MRFKLLLVLPLLLATVALASAQKQEGVTDIGLQMEAAKKIATKKNKRVLVVLSEKEHQAKKDWRKVLSADRQNGTTVFNEFETVWVNVSDIKSESNTKKFSIQNDTLKDLPKLVVYDKGGKKIGAMPFASFQGEGKEKELGKFLAKVKVPMPSAKKALSDALAKAKVEKKRVFVHLGAPWCGWCFRLEEFLSREKFAKRFSKDWIDLKIDVDRMEEGKEVADILRKGSKSGGIPWSVILDSDGKRMITADSPKGNMGCPVADHEREWFKKMMVTTKIRSTDEDINAMVEELDLFAKPILEKMEQSRKEYEKRQKAKKKASKK